MAAPVHYIRTIHTSFTAAHPHSSSAWASHATASSMSRVHTHSNILQNMTITYTNSPPASKYPPGLGAPMGRKRSASIRVAPPAYAQRIQRVKFDPFAEESESPSSLVTTSVLYNSAYHHHAPATARSTTTRPASMPYTIQIPPAAPADIQRHQQQQQQYRQQQQQQQGVRVKQQPTPPPVQRVPTPAVIAAAPPQNTIATANREREARSKIVAGILLNRVHAVGKPMRRRVTEQPRAYVPSGLSTCVSIEA
jgi:hypothetical protein